MNELTKEQEQANKESMSAIPLIKGGLYNNQSFRDFINRTELSEKDKNLVKGVYYGWLKENGVRK